MLTKTRNRMDELLGEVFDFYGANKGEKTFRLKNANGGDYLFKIVGDRQNITEIQELPIAPDTVIPRGCRREEPLATIMLYSYDKQDNLHNAIAPGKDFFDAVWNRGYLLMDLSNGHPWLRFGHHNYRSPKGQRVAFIYSAVDDEDDGEE